MLKLFSFFILFFASLFVCKSQDEVKVRLTTTSGIIELKLYNETPLHKENFIKLVNNGTYNGVLFHRVIKGFMIQTGDPTSKNSVPDKLYGIGDVGYTIPAEINYKYFHKKGALSAARKGDNVNPKKESSGSQFYIVQGTVFTDEMLVQIDAHLKKIANIQLTPEQKQVYKTLGGAPHLDGQYTVFGEVTKGLEIVDLIGNVTTGKNDRPLTDLKVIKAEIIK